ncbi:MAG TPA: type II secretion system F family protein [Dehalococcoidia bacterium]|nr:type II secretion system F family protein [Dehalococcoidia bacterium]
MDIVALGAALAVMGAVVFGLLGIYQATAHPRGNIERRLGAILGEGGSGGGQATAVDYEALRPTKVGRTPILASLLQGKAWTSKVADDLEKADLKLTVSEYLALRLMLALFGAMAPLFILGRGPIGMLAMAGVATAAFMAPSLYVSYAKGRRLKKLDYQLIEALSLISNSLKAGFGLIQSLELAARQMEHPIATEFRRTLHDINVGSSNEAALSALAKRSGSKDFDIVITAMLIQQSTGGNLAEILDNVSHTMRERIRIRGEIATLTAQQMLTGFIIGGLPFVMALGFSVLSPDYMTPLFNTIEGNIMLVGAGCLELTGVVIIRKILQIEV